MRLTEEKTVKDFTIDTDAHFILEHILTSFGFPKILMSDRGTNYFNESIEVLTEEFHIHQVKSTLYHPQAYGTVQDSIKILENALTKICNDDQSDWDVYIPSMLWAYRTTSKKLTRNTPSSMVYVKEGIMATEYIVLDLCTAAFTNMAETDIMEEFLAQLVALEED